MGKGDSMREMRSNPKRDSIGKQIKLGVKGGGVSGIKPWHTPLPWGQGRQYAKFNIFSALPPREGGVSEFDSLTPPLPSPLT